jgi:hypothetical protein
MGVIVTWEKSGVVAAFIEERREMVQGEGRLTAAFAGSMGRPCWALWPWWPRLAREAGCVRIMDYSGMASLDRAPGVRFNENKLLFEGYALERLAESELSAIDRIERRDDEEAAWLVAAAARHPEGILVRDPIEAARIGQVRAYTCTYLGRQPDVHWSCTAAETADHHRRNRYPSPEDATLLLLARRGYRLDAIQHDEPGHAIGGERVVPVESDPFDWLAEARAYWVGVRHDLEAAKDAAARKPLTPERLDELIDEDRARRAANRAELERQMEGYRARIRSKRVDALLAELGAVFMYAVARESASRALEMRSLVLLDEAHQIYEESLECGWQRWGLDLTHRWQP